MSHLEIFSYNKWWDMSLEGMGCTIDEQELDAWCHSLSVTDAWTRFVFTFAWTVQTIPTSFHNYWTEVRRETYRVLEKKSLLPYAINPFLSGLAESYFDQTYTVYRQKYFQEHPKISSKFFFCQGKAKTNHSKEISNWTQTRDPHTFWKTQFCLLPLLMLTSRRYIK